MFCLKYRGIKERIMKNKKIFFVILGMVLLSLISLSIAQERYAYIDATLMNQDPYPAEPNTYVEILVKFENNGMDNVNDFMTEVIPEYPFSLDPGSNGVVKIGNIEGLQEDGEAIFVKYKIRVDKDAIDGDNSIKIRYTYNTGVYGTIIGKKN